MPITAKQVIEFYAGASVEDQKVIIKAIEPTLLSEMKAKIKTQQPDEKAIDLAVQKERERILAIEALAVVGAEKIIEKAKKDPKATEQTVAVEIIKAMNAGEFKLAAPTGVEALAGDTVTVVSAAITQETPEKTEEKSIEEEIKLGMEIAKTVMGENK